MEEIQEIQEIKQEVPAVPEIKEVKEKKYPRKLPKNPQYYNEYYHQHNEKVPCEFCGVLVGKRRMCKHIKSKGCQLVQGCYTKAPRVVEVVKSMAAPRALEEPRIRELITIEQKMFRILDKYFDELSQKRI